MATTTKSWTRADLERFPDDGNRYEVLDGELLVTPLASFDHQSVVTELSARLHAWCSAHQVATIVAPGAIPRGESQLQPDILVVPRVSRSEGHDWATLPRPILVVEVLSPSTRRYDLSVKRDAYLRWGIPEYWIVDIEERCITVVRPGRDDERVVDTLRWQPKPDLPALEIRLSDLFA
jgi:Uma2 family endonuclease